jgi:hypothetical protein
MLVADTNFIHELEEVPTAKRIWLKFYIFHSTFTGVDDRSSTGLFPNMGDLSAIGLFPPCIKHFQQGYFHRSQTDTLTHTYSGPSHCRVCLNCVNFQIIKEQSCA